MATQMKVQLALLLLACVCTVYGEDGGGERDVCTHGMAAYETFIHFIGCEPENPRDLLIQLLGSLSGDFTVDDLRRVLTTFCSTVMPRMRQCFAKTVRKCSDERERYLMTLAQHSGIICQPYTTSINSQMRHLLSKLTDADLVENAACDVDSREHMDRVCHNRTMAVLGAPSGDLSVLENLPLEVLASRVPWAYRTWFECVVRSIRDAPERCPEWRGVAVRAVQFIFWPVLGNRMTFTNQDIDRLFEWNSPSRRDDTGGLDDFMQLSEEWP